LALVTNAKLAAAASAGAGAAMGWWAFWHEPRSVELTRLTLRLPGWPEELVGLKVGVIADLHTGAPQVDIAKVHRLVERLNRERPDLVALLGDYADPDVILGHRVEPADVAAALAGLQAPLGRYAVLGNHDWDEHGAAMPRALSDRGITVLENDALPVSAAPTPLWIAGIADASRRLPRLDEALAVVPAEDPVLLLSHHPDVFPHVPTRVALTLSGHTHGAQVDIPGVRDKVTPSQYGAHYTQGHQIEGGRHLFVSSGVGTSRLPVRFRARPEIALLELVS
jgi:predicted MPP superfamily phosphohydrolase